MNSAVCTLFEGDYHYGVGALVNSLYKHGFRGVVWAGYRGALPPWAKNLQECSQYHEFEVTEGCCIRFVPIVTEMHLTNYKPTFMLDVWDNYCPNIESIFYFDPDITIKCRWSFFEEWVGYGVALCQEIVHSNMPHNHPIRMRWQLYAEKQGFTVINQINQYFNGGFIGVKKKFLSFLCQWQELIHGLYDEGVALENFMPGDRSQPFLATDQDALNITTMVCKVPVSSIGPEGMDFIPSGFTMSHAVGSPKPWRKKMLKQSLVGRPPTLADKNYFINVQKPIQVYRAVTLFRQMTDLKMGAAIGRFIRKS